MKLITKEIEKKAPALYSTGEMDSKDIKIVAKFFNPVGSATWYMTEYDKEKELAFGYVTGMQVDELGYFSIAELKSVRLQFGLGIERDRYFSGATLADIMSGKRR
jgi:hypothetical protein